MSVWTGFRAAAMPALVLTSGLIGLGAAASAAADDGPAQLRLRSLAAACAQCHGTDGQPVAGSTVPPLAGRPEADTLRQMAAFKAADGGAGGVMPQIARGFSDAQIRQLAAYFAAQAR
jgi:sulfide dehydrogenase cytochrome subunit